MKLVSEEALRKSYLTKKNKIQKEVIKNLQKIAKGALKIVDEFIKPNTSISATEFKCAVQILEKWLPAFNKNIEIGSKGKHVEEMTIEEVQEEIKKLL